LRQALYYLRQSLGEGVLVGRGEEEIGLDGERFWSDIGAFDDALKQGDAEQALELYRGELLAGFFVSGAPAFEQWLAERREELRRRACVAACELADRAGSDGNAAAAGHWARRATGLAPFDEGVVTQAIALLDRMGDRSGAVRLYEAFARRLEEELELQPSPETQGLVDEIRSRTELRQERSSAAGSGTAAGEVRELPTQAAEPPSEPSSSGPVSTARPAGLKARGRGFRLGVLVGVGLTIAIGLAWAFRSQAPVLDPGRVVVAVFDNQTGDPDLDPLGRMAADWITQGLVESGLADVVPSTIGLAPRPDFADPESAGKGGATALAEATGAGTIVAGAYYRRGDSVELQAQVIDARDGRLLSAVAPASGSLDDPGAAVDSLRRSVVRTLAVLLEPSLRASTAAIHPPSLEAYREYLEGLRMFEHSNQMREALGYFYNAVALDSTFIAPRFYIVFAHWNVGEPAAADSNAQLLVAQRPLLTEYQRNTLDWQLAVMHGDQMAALEATRARGGIDVGVQALKVNRPQEAVDVLADAEDLSDYYFHSLTLTEAYHMLGDYRGELREARRVHKSYPERLRPLDAELRALAALSRIDEVERRLEESLSLPQEGSLTSAQLMGGAAAELRAHGSRQASLNLADRAIEWYVDRPAAEATAWWHRYGLALAYYQRELWEEARQLFDLLVIETPNDVNLRGYLGVLAARRGDRELALSISQELEGLAAPMDFGRDTYWQACIASLLGERERAMVLLRRAYARGRPFSVRLHRDMDLESLHDYPPFQEFIRPKG
jgi:DNA-binding SARP family transcriptional activator/TolB-like protein